MLGKLTLIKTKKKLGWPLEPTFFVPDEVRELFSRRVKSLKKDYDIIIGYFSIADTIGHLNFGNKVMIKIIYKELDELAGNLGKNNKILILSDHGMKTVGKFGVHSDHGFWSINFNYKLKNPKITDFFNIIKVV